MICYPECGGCEWTHIAPFIAHLNAQEGTSYQSPERFDPQRPWRPVPEDVYTQANGGTPLVVERKQVIWPPDYAETHRRDIELADAFIGRLSPFVGDDPISMHLQRGFDGSKADAAGFVEAIVSQVRHRLKDLGDKSVPHSAPRAP